MSPRRNRYLRDGASCGGGTGTLAAPPSIGRTFLKTMRGVAITPIKKAEDSSPQRLELSGIGSEGGSLGNDAYHQLVGAVPKNVSKRESRI